MSRKRSRPVSRRRTKDDVIRAVFNSVDELDYLISGYDAGRFHLARTMAQTLDRLIRSELLHTRLRNDLSYLSFGSETDDGNIMTSMTHFGVMLKNSIQDPQGRHCIQFYPMTRRDEDGPGLPNPPTEKSFRVWNDEPIFVEGAGGRSNTIPLLTKDQVPFGKRRKLTRGQLLNRTRNEVGAHFDMNESEDFAFSRQWLGLYNFGIVEKDGAEVNTSANPERFLFQNTPADAMIRTIAEEVVDSARLWAPLRDS